MDLFSRVKECLKFNTDNNTDNILKPKYTEFISNQKENFFECAICLELMKTNENLILINCSHIFHKDCLELWSKKKKSCPYCDFNF